MEEGEIGRLQLLRLTGTEPILPASNLTNIFRNTAIHDFDLVRWLSGDEVTSVFAEGASRDGGRLDPTQDPDTIIAILRLRSGALAVVSVSRLSPLGYDVRTELLGSMNHVSVGWTDRSPVQSLDGSRSTFHGDIWKTWQERFEDAYRAELSAFIAVAGGKRAVPVGVHDAVEAQRLAEAARRSVEKGVPVTLDHDEL